MERNIGEIFEYNGEWYQCISDTTDDDCNNCFFQKSCSDITGDITGDCSSVARSDGKSVCFKKLEKVGEPFFVNIQGNNVLKQRYKLYEPKVILENYWYRIDGNFISIEVKQNKEDMEEKKQCGDNRFRAIARAKEHLFQATNIAEDKKELEVLDSFLLRCWQMGWLKQYEDAEEKKLNLKPFDLQKAREGKPVCTRDGRKARIICFDAKGEHPIIALVTDGAQESPYNYTEKGYHYIEDVETMADLMMLPEKKEGWININKDACLFKSKEEAERYCTKDYVPVRVEFEM